MRKLVLFITFIVCMIHFSCEEQVTQREPGLLYYTQHILQNYNITSIAFDSREVAWIGTFKQGMIKYDDDIKYYNSENSDLPDSVIVWDLMVDRNDNVWIGSNLGMIKYDKSSFTVYNKNNSPIAEDVVWSIVQDEDNLLWLSSCRFKQGGLMTFDGVNWTLYTPDNSELPANGVRDIAIDSQNRVWFTNNDAVYSDCIVCIDDNNWTIFNKDDFGFNPYYFGYITVDTEDRIFATLDYSLSSSYDVTRPNVLKYDGEEWNIIFPPENNIDSLVFNGKVYSDNRGNIWATLYNKEGLFLSSYDGEKWSYYSTNIPTSSITEIVFDSDNTMWLGTDDGIYIIIQE